MVHGLTLSLFNTVPATQFAVSSVMPERLSADGPRVHYNGEVMATKEKGAAGDGSLMELPPLLSLNGVVPLLPKAHHEEAEPPPGFRSLDFTHVDAPRLTHQTFRYPAKFHPPVVHSLIRAYTTAGQTLLDPFCGSGTLLLAAASEGRNAIGTDVDPLAVFVAQAKTHRFRPRSLKASWGSLWPLLESLSRSPTEYDALQYDRTSRSSSINLL